MAKSEDLGRKSAFAIVIALSKGKNLENDYYYANKTMYNWVVRHRKPDGSICIAAVIGAGG